MDILVVGATGATGRLLAEELIARGHRVRAIVRSENKFPEELRSHTRLELIRASILDLSIHDLATCVKGCDAIASCLGHNLSIRGILGPPWKLVTRATINLCRAIQVNRAEEPVRFVLMNTTGTRNRDLEEKRTLAENLIVALLRILLPPYTDNVKAAEVLRRFEPDHPFIHWAVVRPDTLIDQDRVTEYVAHPSPVRSPLFNAGKTSRINVAHFMADLLTGEDAWSHWQGRMPVLYNHGQLK